MQILVPKEHKIRLARKLYEVGYDRLNFMRYQ